MFLVRFNEVREEFVASREGVTMCDYSSFAKFDVWSAGTEAVEFLQKMCSNDIDVPIGHIVHTGMHNKFGGKKSIVNLSSVICNNLLCLFRLRKRLLRRPPGLQPIHADVAFNSTNQVSHLDETQFAANKRCAHIRISHFLNDGHYV